MINTTGVIDGMSDAEYHADPVEGGSLSSSGAKDILRSPALYQWNRTHRVEKDTYDVGHAVHAKVLGVGLPAVEIPADILASNGATSTKAAKEFIDDARAAGLVPLKADVIREIEAMAESVLTHAVARPLLEKPGKSEQSLFAPDPTTGVWLRARLDRLPDVDRGQTVAVDLKTAVSADPSEFRNSAASYGYDIQSEFYQHALGLARGDDDIAFRFVVVEKSAPYLVSVVELDAEYAVVGRARMRRAINTYAACTDDGEWPGYAPVVHYVDPPRWLAYEEGLAI